MSRLRRSATLLSLAGVGAIAIGATVGVALTPQQRPATLASPSPHDHIDVTSEEFLDSAPVEIEVTTSASGDARIPRAGVLSRADCRSGSALESGVNAFSIEGEPLLNLVMPLPLWRDLELGEAGADVDSLRAGLRALGDDLDEHGPVTTMLVNALNNRLASINAPGRVSGVSHESIVWLGSAVAVASCPVTVGTHLQAGDVIAEFVPAVESARVTRLPGGLAERRYVVEVDGQVFDLDKDGTLADPARLATDPALNRVRDTAAGGPDSPSRTVHGEYRLAEPLDVLVVPPSSVILAAGTAGCVISGDRQVNVRIVGSELGKTMVVPAAPTRLHSVRVQPEASWKCT